MPRRDGERWQRGKEELMAFEVTQARVPTGGVDVTIE